LITELATTETQLNRALNVAEKIAAECELGQQRIKQLQQSVIEKTQAITNLQTAVDQRFANTEQSIKNIEAEANTLAEKLEKEQTNVTFWKRFTGLTGLTLTGLLLLLILHKTDQLENFLNKLPIPSFSN
jgi:multidrug resistance efflux pump